MKLNLTKQNGVLIPFDDEAKAAIAKWKDNDFVTCEVKRPRNNKHHAKFFAMLNIILNNTDEVKSMDELLGYVKIQTGWTEIIELKGMAFRMPKSIAFSKMDQQQFDIFYSNAVNVCLKLVPMDKEDLANEIALTF